MSSEASDVIEVPVHHAHNTAQSEQKNKEMAQRLEQETRQFTGGYLMQTSQMLLQLDQITAKVQREHHLKMKQQRARCENEKVNMVVTKHRLEEQLKRAQLGELLRRKQRLAQELRESLLLFKQVNADVLAGEEKHDRLVHQLAEVEKAQEEHLVEKQTAAAFNRQMHLEQIKEKAAHDVQHAKDVTEHQQQAEDYAENVMRAVQNRTLERTEKKHDAILQDRVMRASNENEHVRAKHLDVIFNRNPQLGQALNRVVQCELELTKVIQQNFLTDFRLDYLHQVLENNEKLHAALTEYLEMRSTDDFQHALHMHEEQTTYWQPPSEPADSSAAVDAAAAAGSTNPTAPATTAPTIPEETNPSSEGCGAIPPSSTVSEAGSIADITSVEADETNPIRWPDDEPDVQQPDDDYDDEETDLRNQYGLDDDDVPACPHAGRSGYHAMSIDKMVRRLDKICHHKQSK